jgi:RHS repeat-associated protein
VLSDTINNYMYDAEGRLCAVSYVNSQMMTEYMIYVYDGEGRRVAKVLNSTTFSCNPTGSGSSLQEAYLLGPSGEHITELGPSGTFIRSNVYANGQLLATYANSKTYFTLNDWLGSKRVVTNYDGTVAETCLNFPFGDALTCSAPDVSEQSFTGQIYDPESKNYYFNARYYSESTGRFLSPDWSGVPEAVPYADFANPQSLNLYAYVADNPLSSVDPDGHGCYGFGGTQWNVSASLSVDGGDSTSVGSNSGTDSSQTLCTDDVVLQTQVDPQQKQNFPISGLALGGQLRQIDPNGQECKALAAKIGNIVADIEGSRVDLATNPLGLPQSPPYPGAPRRMSVQGHNELLDEKIQNLANRAHEYNQKCGGGDPFGGGAPSSAPSSSAAPGSESSNSSNLKRGLILGGGAIVIGGAVLLCPECLVAVPALSF